MTKYLVAPYVIQTKARGSRGGALRSIDNLDGRGLSLMTAIGHVLGSMVERDEPYQDTTDPNKMYELNEVRVSEGRAFLLSVEPGRRGLQSTVRRQEGSRFTRRTDDTEFVPLRHLIYFPPGGYSALLFAERFGRMGAITFLRTCLHTAFREHFAPLTMTIDPLTTLQALETATYKKLSFKAPRPKDPSGRLLDFAPSVVVDVSLRHARRVKDLTTPEGTIDSSKVFGVLQNEARGSGLQLGADTAGWDAAMTVEMQSGQPRTFNIEDEGPPLVYAINGTTVGGTQISHTSHPTVSEFLSVCQVILNDIAGQFDVRSEDRLPSDQALRAWEYTDGTPWEVTHYDDFESSGNSAGSVHA